MLKDSHGHGESGTTAGTGAGSAAGSRVWAVLRLVGRVARTEPARMVPNAASMTGVTCSPSTATPSETAIAGLIYVNTLARAGPTSAISRKKIRNAAAVQTTASPAIDNSTLADGTADGQFRAASGA